MKERLVLKYTILLRPVPMYTTYRESEFVWTLRLFACQGVEIYSLVDYYDQKKLLWHVCWSGGWINQKYDQLSRQLDWAELGNILPFSMNSIKYIIVFRKTPNTALRFMLLNIEPRDFPIGNLMNLHPTFWGSYIHHHH